MINCAHPTHFEDAIEGGAAWATRIRGLRANASTKSHAELDEAEELDEGDPDDLGAALRRPAGPAAEPERAGRLLRHGPPARLRRPRRLVKTSLRGGHRPRLRKTRYLRVSDATLPITRSFLLTLETLGRMALRDTWHRTLVYFGLAEEEDPRYEAIPDHEPEAELEDRYRERPNVRRLQRRRRDEFDDIFADEAPRGRETRVLRPVGGNGSGRGGDIQVHLVIPKSFNDAQQIADQFKDAVPVILNLQSTDTDLSKRLIDFASGLTYALDGGMQRIADKVFLLTPRNVEVSAEERARLIEKGFFNQS